MELVIKSLETELNPEQHPFLVDMAKIPSEVGIERMRLTADAINEKKDLAHHTVVLLGLKCVDGIVKVKRDIRIEEEMTVDMDEKIDDESLLRLQLSLMMALLRNPDIDDGTLMQFNYMVKSHPFVEDHIKNAAEEFRSRRGYDDGSRTRDYISKQYNGNFRDNWVVFLLASLQIPPPTVNRIILYMTSDTGKSGKLNKTERMMSELLIHINDTIKNVKSGKSQKNPKQFMKGHIPLRNNLGKHYKAKTGETINFGQVLNLLSKVMWFFNYAPPKN